MTRPLIRPRVMAGVRQWWDAHVDPDPLFRHSSSVPSVFPTVWWLPDGRLLPERPESEFLRYFAMPCRAILIED